MKFFNKSMKITDKVTMAKDKKAEGNFYLFTNENDHKIQTSQLNKIYGCLRHLKPFKLRKNFAHVSSSQSFLRDLNFKENLLLESFPTHVSVEKDSLLEKYLSKNRNLYFQELFQKVDFWKKLPNEVSQKDLALFSLIRAFAKKTKCIIIECPDEIFSKELTNIIQKALIYEALHNGVNVVIHLKNEDSTWSKICDYKITHHQKKRYTLTENKEEVIKPLINEFRVEKKSA